MHQTLATVLCGCRETQLLRLLLAMNSKGHHAKVPLLDQGHLIDLSSACEVVAMTSRMRTEPRQSFAGNQPRFPSQCGHGLAVLG